MAVSSTEIDLEPIEVGHRITVTWRGKPVFIDHRTPEQIDRALLDDIANLPDFQLDAERTQEQEWLVVVGVCTHLGCIPLGQRLTDPKGEYGGWFCPCHGSHYDTSGRIRKGPAQRNLDVPEHQFLNDSRIRIG